MQIGTEEIGQAFIKLAECLTTDDCKITAHEIFEEIECRLISEEDARDIRKWLNTNSN